MSKKGEKGTVYLLCFSEHYHHARHYIGWTANLPERLDQHRHGNGARLLQVVADAGITFDCVRTWPDVTRTQERQLKKQKNASRFCPRCVAHPASPWT